MTLPLEIGDVGITQFADGDDLMCSGFGLEGGKIPLPTFPRTLKQPCAIPWRVTVWEATNSRRRGLVRLGWLSGSRALSLELHRSREALVL